jgi:hypothetical protein
VVDPQRDIIDHRKRSKSLGKAAQFNGRQSSSSLSLRRCRPLIYRWINISTNGWATKRLDGLRFRLKIRAAALASHLARHARLYAGHPRLCGIQERKTWMAGTSCAKTRFAL